jgi:hypothetical protein
MHRFTAVPSQQFAPEWVARETERSDTDSDRPSRMPGSSPQAYRSAGPDCAPGQPGPPARVSEAGDRRRSASTTWSPLLLRKPGAHRPSAAAATVVMRASLSLRFRSYKGPEPATSLRVVRPSPAIINVIRTESILAAAHTASVAGGWRLVPLQVTRAHVAISVLATLQ